MILKMYFLFSLYFDSEPTASASVSRDSVSKKRQKNKDIEK